MPKTSSSKLQTLRENGTLNPTPESVRDEVFAESVFFDPNDLLQVKYEMLRALEVDGQSIAGTAEAFGVSRPTVYEAKANFETKGLLGLLPEKRGPKHPHKLTPDVMKVVTGWILKEPEIDSSALAARVKERWRVTVHPRTIEKALVREAKRGRPKK